MWFLVWEKDVSSRLRFRGRQDRARSTPLVIRRPSAMACIICKQDTEASYFALPWNVPHYKMYHADFSNWLRKWFKIFITVGSVDVSIFAIILYLVYNYWTPDLNSVLIPILAYIVPMWLLILWSLRKISFYKREWKEQRPFNSLGGKTDGSPFSSSSSESRTSKSCLGTLSH